MFNLLTQSRVMATTAGLKMLNIVCRNKVIYLGNISICWVIEKVVIQRQADSIV
jgi:hypothetical protein